MPLHPQAKAVLDGNDWSDLDPEATGIAALRETMNARLIELAGDGPPVSSVKDLSFMNAGASIPVRVYAPARSDAALPVYVYFHSGGYCVYDIDTADAQCRVIANTAGCVVVSVGYRLAPEASFPAAVEDAWASLRWLVSQAEALGIDPDRIAVGGESCGGTLATVCSLLARDNGGPALCQIVLSCALLEISAPRSGEQKTLATWMRDQYLTKPSDAGDFRASPLGHPDLAGLPPHLVVTAEFDGLRDQGAAYAKRLEAAGTPVVQRDYPGMIHNFTGMRAGVDDADEALSLIAGTLAAAFGTNPSPA